MKLITSILMVIGLVVTAGAQTTKPVNNNNNSVSIDLTDTETMALSYVAQQEQELRTAYEKLMNQEQALVAEINKDHPGYTFNLRTGKLEKATKEPAKTK